MAPHGDCEYCPGGPSHAEMIQAVERLKATSNEQQVESCKSSPM